MFLGTTNRKSIFATWDNDSAPLIFCLIIDRALPRSPRLMKSNAELNFIAA
jgi:hypothetical protein